MRFLQLLLTELLLILYLIFLFRRIYILIHTSFSKATLLKAKKKMLHASAHLSHYHILTFTF
jgi:ABC-type maltose transport system permease subunit